MNKPKINHFYSIIIVLIIGLSAQNTIAQDFRLGFKGTPVFSSIKPGSDYNNSTGTKIGFSYGLIFDYFLKEHYAVETEFGISSLGGNIEYSKAEVPITIKLLTDNINGKMKVFGKFGMNLGFATKSSAVISYKKNGVEYAKDDMKDASKYIQPLNVSLVIGGGVEYNLAKNLDLILGLTYTNGLLNTMKSPSIYRLNTSNPSIKAFDADMNYFAINVGLLF
jgi:hypothetical protein